MTHLANIDKDYASWIENLSQRYKHSQIKAATHVNSEMLQFYWSLGKDIVTLHAESRWGDKIIKYRFEGKRCHLNLRYFPTDWR